MGDQADRQPGPFRSFEALREAHSNQMRNLSSGSRASEDHALRGNAIRSFIADVEASGRSIEKSSDRERAQGILDYWAAELIASSKIDDAVWTPPKLAAFDPFLHNDAPAQTFAEKEAQSERQAASREQIRLAATARQYRASRREGYLLTGEALDEAMRFQGADPDIDRLIAASKQAAKGRERRRVIASSGLIIILAVALVAMDFLWWKAYAAKQKAEDAARAEASAKADAKSEAKELKTAIAVKDLSMLAWQDRFREFNSTQLQLDAALRAIRKGVDSGEIARSAIPEEILKAAQAGADANAPAFPTNSELLTGYDPQFLGSALPLPHLAQAIAAQAFEQGRPLDYVNYSLVLNARRRMALFTASNLDRQQLRVLPRSLDRFIPDPRVPIKSQPEESWFKDNDFDRGHLVTRQEIAWGPYFGGDPDSASRKLGGMVNIYTNVTPQFDTFNQGVWSKLERWVLTEHNKSAAQVSIFTGPVLRDDDPVVHMVQAPRVFWKIAVSQRFGRNNALIVDAFMAPQFQDSKDEKAAKVDFQPDLFRVSVRDIEQLTGLDFGPAIREAQGAEIASRSAQSNIGQQIAREVRLLDTQDSEQSMTAAQKIIDLIQDDNLPDPEKLKVVVTLAGIAGDAGASTATQRDWLLYILSALPTENWARPAWIDAKATVRRTVADIEARIASGAAETRPDTRMYLDTLKSRLSWDVPLQYTVYLQFAGMTRGDAITVSNDLKALGWRIPGEERTSAAAKTNEVRYGDPTDEAAAMLLAADLRASGLANVRRAVRAPTIKSRNLEIWISQ